MKITDVRSAAILATMAEGVVFHDTQGRIEACNESAERILGLSADQMTGLLSVDPG
jgi:PAS domain S-box-containing protein